MADIKKYEWNQDTIDSFRFESCYISKDAIREQVFNFIDVSCHLEEGDDEDDMAEDLMSKIFD